MAVLVFLVFVFLLGMGLVGLVSPVGTLELAGTHQASANARIEARAVYGGTGIGAALLVAASPFMQDGALVLWALGVVFAAMAVGRLVGLAVDRPDGPLPLVWLGAEIVAAVALVWAGVI